MENSINELLSGQLNALEDESLLQELDDLFASLEPSKSTAASTATAPVPVPLGGAVDHSQHDGIDSLPIAPTTPILPVAPTGPIVLTGKAAVSAAAHPTPAAALA